MARLEFFRRVDTPAGRVSDWWTILGPGGVMMTAMTALASYWPAAAEHGWPGIIIAGVFLTGILGAGLGGAAIAWRTIRPLPSPAGGGTAGPAASVTSS